jgi:lambda family phage portal protein
MATKANALDRVIGYLSPARGEQRLRARARFDHRRSYEGASKSARLKNWRTTSTSANAEIDASIETLISRSRQLTRDNPWAMRAIGIIASNTVGTGIIPQVKGATPALTAKLEERWALWAKETAIDADDRLDFYGIQSLVLKTVVKSGSCLVRRRRRRPADGLPVPLQVQVLEPDFLDRRKDGNLQGGGFIVGGVEFSAIGKRVAYHLYKSHPGETGKFFTLPESSRVPAEDICHVYRIDRPGQAVGVPWAAPILIRTRELDEYEDAELVRQKVAACYTAFVHRNDDSADFGGEMPTTGEQTNRDRAEHIEPAAIEYLDEGESVTFGQPPQNQGYDTHVRAVLRSIAAGFGVTYEALTGDLSQVNFSSARMGWLEFQRNVDEWRTQMLIPQLCKPVWEWFVEGAVLAGHVPEGAPVTWMSPRREMIDPVKETSAAKDMVRSGMKSWTQVVAESGRDPEEVAAELAADFKRFDDLGLMLDCDPRKRTSIG